MPEISVNYEAYNSGRVATIIIENEAKLNALTSEMISSLTTTARKLALDDSLRAVVLTGSGEKSFIVGAAINEMEKLDQISARIFITNLHDAFQALRDIPVPVIARIQGYCFGAGLELAASCDLRIAAESATMGMPEPFIGLPSVIEAALLPSLIGWGRTRELLYLGDTITASDAYSMGLVGKVVADNKLDDAVNTWVDKILRGGPLSIRLQKKLIQQWERVSVIDGVHAGIESFSATYASDEPHKMLGDWLQSKRKN